MKDVLLFGYGKMGSSIARGWLLKKVDFNFFMVAEGAYTSPVSEDFLPLGVLHFCLVHFFKDF